jgi:hypothetical protein
MSPLGGTRGLSHGRRYTRPKLIQSVILKVPSSYCNICTMGLRVRTDKTNCKHMFSYSVETIYHGCIKSDMTIQLQQEKQEMARLMNCRRTTSTVVYIGIAAHCSERRVYTHALVWKWNSNKGANHCLFTRTLQSPCAVSQQKVGPSLDRNVASSSTTYR